jgi:hypothetical protein
LEVRLASWFQHLLKNTNIVATSSIEKRVHPPEAKILEELATAPIFISYRALEDAGVIPASHALSLAKKSLGVPLSFVILGDRKM